MPRSARQRLQGMLKKAPSVREEPKYRPGRGKSMKSVTKGFVEPIGKGPKLKRTRKRKGPKHFGDTFDMDSM